MKKKVVAKKSAAKTVKKTAPKKSRASSSSVVSYQRIVVYTAAIVLALVAVVGFNKPAVQQSVAGMSVAKGFFSQATVDLPEVDGAVSLNIYYKKKGGASYDNAVRNIPVSTKSYTVSYLIKGVPYEYQVVGVDASGKEFWFGTSQLFTEVEPM